MGREWDVNEIVEHEIGKVVADILEKKNVRKQVEKSVDKALKNLDQIVADEVKEKIEWAVDDCLKFDEGVLHNTVESAMKNLVKEVFEAGYNKLTNKEIKIEIED
jgi:HD superfamily phosphohydrolase YqeK